MTLALLLVIASFFGASGTSEDVTLLVRDGIGNPLSGVVLEVWEAGPPATFRLSCRTDEAGTCEAELPPGSYLVRFTGMYEGKPFMPADTQNPGGDDMGGAGGFAIFIDPVVSEARFGFVIAEDEGILVPLWDMQADPAGPPEPYTAPYGDDIPFLSGPLIPHEDDTPSTGEETLLISPGQQEQADSSQDQEEERRTTILLLLVISMASAGAYLVCRWWRKTH